MVDPAPTRWPPQRRAGESGAVRGARRRRRSAEVAEPGSADLVLCHGVLEHVDDVDPASRPWRGARPGGVLEPAGRPERRRAGPCYPGRFEARHASRTRTAGSVPATRCPPVHRRPAWAGRRPGLTVAPSTAYAASPTWCPVRSSTRAGRADAVVALERTATTPTSGPSRPSCVRPCARPGGVRSLAMSRSQQLTGRGHRAGHRRRRRAPSCTSTWTRSTPRSSSSPARPRGTPVIVGGGPLRGALGHLRGAGSVHSAMPMSGRRSARRPR